MRNYRRVYIPGGTYFFTLVSYRRQPIFVDDGRVELLRRSFREVKSKRPFDLLAAVVLPVICIACGVCQRAMLIFIPDGKR